MGRSSGTPYGCRGGTSATAGKKRATFEVTAPDGTVHKAHSFKVTSETAWFQFAKNKKGELCASGPHRDQSYSFLPKPDDAYWGYTDHQWIEGHRI